MRRRKFISLAGAAVAWPLAARAQRPTAKVPRIGLLNRKTDASVSTQIHAFRQGLRDLGWAEGKRISIEYRDAEVNLIVSVPSLPSLLLLVKIGSKKWDRYGLKSWIDAAKKRLHHNVLAIALANKLARIAWAVLNKGRAFECVKIYAPRAA